MKRVQKQSRKKRKHSTQSGDGDTTEVKKDDKTASPKTGDDMNLAVLYILLAVSGMGCLYTIRKR